MTETQIITLIIAILGVLHGPITAQLARWGKRWPVLRAVADTIKVLWRFRSGPGN